VGYAAGLVWEVVCAGSRVTHPTGSGGWRGREGVDGRAGHDGFGWVGGRFRVGVVGYAAGLGWSGTLRVQKI